MYLLHIVLGIRFVVCRQSTGDQRELETGSDSLTETFLYSYCHQLVELDCLSLYKIVLKPPENPEKCD